MGYADDYDLVGKDTAASGGTFGTAGTSGILAPQQGVFRKPRRARDVDKEEGPNITVGTPVQLVPTRGTGPDRRKKPGEGSLYGPAWSTKYSPDQMEKGVTGGGSAGGDSTGAPAFGAHTFIVGDLAEGDFREGPRSRRVNPYEALFQRPGLKVMAKFDPGQPRDEGGRWTAGGGAEVGSAELGFKRPPLSAGLRARLSGTKVVDASGAPARVYHGTSTPFAGEFDPERISPSSALGPGFYFAEEPARANEYVGPRGAVVPAWLDIRNPVEHQEPFPMDKMPRLTESVGEAIEAQVRREYAGAAPEQVARRISIRKEDWADRLKDWAKDPPRGVNVLSAVETVAGRDAHAVLGRVGFDGVHYPADRTWVAWRADQIHGAFEKRDGTPDARKPRKFPDVNPELGFNDSYDALVKVLDGKAVAIDFDGTLTSDADGTENSRMRDLVETLDGEGVRIVVFSARDPDEIKEWLEEHGWPELEVTNVKSPDFAVMLDDRAVHFEPSLVSGPQGVRDLADRLMGFKAHWEAKYSEDQPRDEGGKWSETGGGVGVVEAKDIVEEAGALWNGVQEDPDEPGGHAMFTDRVTLSTAMVPMREVTPERVREKLAEVRARHGIGKQGPPALDIKPRRPRPPGDPGEGATADGTLLARSALYLSHSDYVIE